MDLIKFRVRFPEFADVADPTDDVLTLLAEDAAVFIGTDATRWCGNFDIAEAYLVAHLVSLRAANEAGAGGSSAAGPITAKTAGGVSVAYAQAGQLDQNDTFYLTTAYGKFFLQLRNQCFGGAVTVGVDTSGISGVLASGHCGHLY